MTDTMVSRRDSLKSAAALGVAVALGASAFGVSSAEAAQPHMNKALSDLQAALNQLEAALADKAGHRVKAIALVKEAITETTAGMAAGAI